MRDETFVVSISIGGNGESEGVILSKPVELEVLVLDPSLKPCSALTDALKDARDDARRTTDEGIPSVFGSRSSSSTAESTG